MFVRSGSGEQACRLSSQTAGSGRREPVSGRDLTEGPLHGCQQSQKTAAPTGQRDRAGVSPQTQTHSVHLTVHSALTLSSDVCVYSVSNLHERWSKYCGTYRDLYGQLHELYLPPGLDWSRLLADKQVTATTSPTDRSQD